MQYKIGKVHSIVPDGILMVDGQKLPADILVVAAGCRVNWEPTVLKSMGLGANSVIHSMHESTVMLRPEFWLCHSKFVCVAEAW